MRRPVVAILALALLLPAIALISLGEVGGDTAVTLPPMRAGDTLRYDVRMDEAGGAKEGTVILKAEGPSRARDHFGIERATTAYSLLALVDDEPVRHSRCHALEGSKGGLRTDYFYGGPLDENLRNNSLEVRDVLLSYQAERSAEELRTRFRAPCIGHDWPRGEEAAEGENPSPQLLPEAITSEFSTNNPRVATPGAATTFHGRPAVQFTYDFDREPDENSKVGFLRGTLTVVVADGIPGIAAASFEGTCLPPREGPPRGRDWNAHPFLPFEVCAWRPWTDTDVDRAAFPLTFSFELTGYIPGDGPAPILQGSIWPEHLNPNLELVPSDGFMEDTAFGLPYPLHEALAAIREDPTTGVDDYLKDNPDAVLAHALFDRRLPPPTLVQRRDTGVTYDTDGGWFFIWSSPTSLYYGTTVRVNGAQGPLGPLTPPAQTYSNSPAYFSGARQYDRGYDLKAPLVTPSSASAMALLESEGFTAGEIEWLSIGMSPRGETTETTFWITASNVSLYYPASSPAPDGATASLNPDYGLSAIYNVAFRQERGGLLQVFPQQDDPRWNGGLATASFQMPPLGAGLAVASAALSLAALVLLAVKFLLLPLYTRLRRDRLLENPVRARMYEAIRANPGIHRAELVDYMGIGEGGTRHHLDKLTEGRLVVAHADGGFTRHYAAGEIPPALARQEGVLRAGSNRKVYDLYRAEPHLTLRDAAARLGMSAPAVHRSVKKLREAGLLPAPPTEGNVTLVAGEP